MTSPAQGGTDKEDRLYGAIPGDNGSVVLIGNTRGDWSGENSGGADFAAVKLDENGLVLWRWQVNTVPCTTHLLNDILVLQAGQRVLTRRT